MSTGPSFLLTAQERERFWVWLERQAESNTGIMEQLEKLSVADAVVENMKRETAACLIVARILRSAEDMSADA